MTADDPLGNDGAPDLSLRPSLDWEQMVDQLNQDPHVDLVVDSGQGTISIKGGRTDITGDEEVETRDEGPTTWAVTGPRAGDLDWEPWDPLIEFNDENSGITQIPVAASTPVAAETEGEMPELEDASLEEPLQMGFPQSSGTSTSLVTLPKGFMPNYSDVPLSGFS